MAGDENQITKLAVLNWPRVLISEAADLSIGPGITYLQEKQYHHSQQPIAD